ncbi:MAG: hypothetical protein M0033_08250 [Nitrospiraceae bacterium]|nr:hypothetical protein [Nitrospiraceae bacterium]
MTLEQAQNLTAVAEAAIAAAVEVGMEISKAISESRELTRADKDTLVARIKAAQAATPEWT